MLFGFYLLRLPTYDRKRVAKMIYKSVIKTNFNLNELNMI